MIRIENNTNDLGQQIMIRHRIYHKSYLLLETPVGKFALQKLDDVFVSDSSSCDDTPDETQVVEHMEPRRKHKQLKRH